MKKQEFKKMRRGLGTSGTTLNVPTSESEGCQKEKRKSKKLKTFNSEGKIPQPGKEIDFQKVQKAQSPKEIGPKEEHTQAHHS